MKSEPTIDVSPVRQWLELFASLGIDKDQLLRQLSCKEEYLLQRDNRIAARYHHQMLHYAAGVANIPGIILLSGAQTTPESMGVVGHLMKHSATLAEAGKQIVRYASVLSETGKWCIEKVDESYAVRYSIEHESDAYPEVAEASLSSCIGTLRSLSGKEIIPLEVAFTHPDPGYADVYAKVFGVAAQFDSNECFIRISAEDAQQPIAQHQSYVHALLETHAQELLAKLGESDSVTSKVSRLVAQHLAEGRVDIEWVSAQLCMSRWTLTRHLKQEGVTFNDLVRDIRSELAQKYLHDKNMSVSEVGFLLGYSEPSAFQRAFRGWYQCTPSEFRINH